MRRFLEVAIWLAVASVIVALLKIGKDHDCKRPHDSQGYVGIANCGGVK